MMRKRWGRSIVVETLIGEQTEIQGDVRFAGGLHIDGCVRGQVLSTDQGASLSVGVSGLVEGNVSAPRIMLNGRVLGHVHAGEHISLGPKARVIGNLYYRTLEMATGAKVMGQLIPQEQAAPALIEAGPAQVGVPVRAALK